MADFFSPIIDFVAAHPHYAIAAVFLLALSEALPLIGIVFPGSTLIFGICAIATGADINPWFLLMAAIVGAILGDGLSFWLGQRYKQKISVAWPLNRYPQFVDRSERFITRHGAASVFSGPLRSGSARLRAAGFRHPRNVSAPVLYREYFVGTCLGTGPCFSRSAARYGDQALWCQRGAAHDHYNRWDDHAVGRNLGNTLLLE